MRRTPRVFFYFFLSFLLSKQGGKGFRGKAETEIMNS